METQLVHFRVGSFLANVGMQMIIPFLPLYVQDLGIHEVKKAALWAALIFAENHLMIALISPLWGSVSDKYGQKKMMVFSAFGMGILVILMGFVHNTFELIFLRILFGTVGGFSSSAFALLVIETHKEHVGRVLGILQTGTVCGQLLGPLCGGVLAETIGIKFAFYLTGIFLLIAFLIVYLGVAESIVYSKFKWFRKKKQLQPFEQQQIPRKKTAFS